MAGLFRCGRSWVLLLKLEASVAGLLVVLFSRWVSWEEVSWFSECLENWPLWFFSSQLLHGGLSLLFVIWNHSPFTVKYELQSCVLQLGTLWNKRNNVTEIWSSPFLKCLLCLGMVCLIFLLVWFNMIHNGKTLKSVSMWIYIMFWYPSNLSNDDILHGCYVSYQRWLLNYVSVLVLQSFF